MKQNQSRGIIGIRTSRLFIFCLAGTWIFLANLFGSARAQTNPSGEDIASYHKTLRDSLSGIDRYDVVIESSSIDKRGEEERESITTTRECFRIVLDKEKRRAAAYWARKYSKDQNEIFSYGGLVASSTSYKESSDLRPLTLKSCEYCTDGFESNSIPNPLLIGGTRYPCSVFNQEKVNRIWRTNLADIATFGKMSTSANSIVISVKPPYTRFDATAEFTHHGDWAFDSKSLLPSSYTITYFSRGDAGDKRLVLQRQVISWMEHKSGVHVPSKLVEVDNFPIRVTDETSKTKIHFGERTINYVLDWQSINSDIDERLWNEGNCLDLAFIREACGFDAP